MSDYGCGRATRPMKRLLVALLLCVPLVAEARDPAQVRAFRATHPCPSTGKTTGSCPGWVVDHIVPLCFAGADSPDNMQWQSYTDSLKKDGFERAACALRRSCTP